MRREDLADLSAFVTVAEERSFTRAARRLGLSQSALSQIVRRLEDRLGVRLLARTTRSVAATEAGERLVARLSPMLRDIDESLEALADLRARPSGLIRITAVEHAARTILTPVVCALVEAHPEVTVEIVVDYGLTDIVAERFDAGVRLGESVEKDMIAARISPEIPMAVVASPDHFRRHPPPDAPEALVHHRCINLRLPTSGALYPWRFVRDGQELRVRTTGPLIFGSIDPIREAALQGAGLACLPLDQVEPDLAAGRLVRILAACTQPLPAYRLYYPSRRHHSPAFRLLVEALRRQADG